MDDYLKQFTAVHRYSVAEGYEGGFLSGDSTNSEYYWKVGVMKIHKSENIVPEDIDESDLFRLTDVADMINKANKLDGVGRGKEFVGAIPTFEQGIRDGIITNGVIFFREAAAELINVPVEELKKYDPDVLVSPNSRFFAVNRYLHDQGTHPGGFPTFSEVSLNDESSIEILAIKPGYCSHEGIPDIHFGAQFHEFNDFSWDDEFIIRKATNEVIRSFADSCTLNDEEKVNLRNALKDNVLISPSADVTEYGHYYPETNNIQINLVAIQNSDMDYWFGELCRTTIHEFMHKAGYGHIPQPDAASRYNDSYCEGLPEDAPSDVKKYFGSEPLKAECTFSCPIPPIHN
ncbi:TPA: hypothetical protein QCR48_004863 [Bacillus cereus]|nr:hypothetical protein [Bacillus cereus]